MSPLPVMMLLAAQDGSETAVGDTLTGGDWLRSGLILAAAIVFAMVASRVTRYLISRWVGPGFAAMLTARLIAYIVVLLGMFYALTALGVQVGPLLGALGLGGLVIALALQKVVENFVAAIILQTRRPFTVGETVTLGEVTGTVLDIDSRTTVVRDLDGRIVRIPNSHVVDVDIVNLTREPTRRSRLEVGVAYDSNLEVAFEAINTALSRTPRVRKDPPPLVTLTRFGSSSIDFTIYYWHASDVYSELAARHDLILAVHQSLEAADVTIAFPQVVVWQGQRSDSGTYTDATPEVMVDHPILAANLKAETVRRRTSTWRLPRRRKAGGD